MVTVPTADTLVHGMEILKCTVTSVNAIQHNRHCCIEFVHQNAVINHRVGYFFRYVL